MHIEITKFKGEEKDGTMRTYWAIFKLEKEDGTIRTHAGIFRGRSVHKNRQLKLKIKTVQ